MEVLNVAEESTDHGQAVSESVLLSAYRRLQAAGCPGLRNVDCHWEDSTLVLRGIVPTYYLKQLAQSLFVSDPAIETVENQIVVS
jgi:hypothetical protein